MKLIPVSYHGFTAMDRRFSSPMLPWIVSEIRKRGYNEKLIPGNRQVEHMEGKTWTIVLFIDDKTVEAVPSNWIQGEFCHWPSLATEKLLQAIRKCEPLNTCWPSHNVKIFRNATFDDYGKARAKAKIAEDTSDLNTDTDEIKRKRVQRILSSSESDHSDFSVLPSPPKKRITKYKDNASGVHNKNYQTQHEVTQLDDIEVEYNSVSEKENNNPACKACAEKDKNFKTLSEQIHIIRGITIDILSEVKTIKNDYRKSNIPEQQVTFSTKHTDVKFPLNTDEDFENLEGILQNEDDIQLLVIELAKMGGTNCYNFVKRVLSTCLTNEMALKYSWLGRKGKRIFSKLNMAKVIIYAAEKANVVQNRTDTEIAIQMWLKRASDRKNSQINKKN